MDEDSIEREILIEASAERVWETLTEPEHLGSWFGDAGAAIELRPGGSFELRWAEHGTVRGTVEKVEPVSEFSLRWAPFKDPGGREPTAGNSTLVEFSLMPAEGGTRLRVVESGFSNLDCPSPKRMEHLERNTEGWESKLAELRDYAAGAAVSG